MRNISGHELCEFGLKGKMFVFPRHVIISKLSNSCSKSISNVHILCAKDSTIRRNLTYNRFIKVVSSIPSESNREISDYVHLRFLFSKDLNKIDHNLVNYFSSNAIKYASKKSGAKSQKHAKGKNARELDDLLEELSDDEEDNEVKNTSDPIEQTGARTPAAEFILNLKNPSSKKGKIAGRFLLLGGGFKF